MTRRTGAPITSPKLTTAALLLPSTPRGMDDAEDEVEEEEVVVEVESDAR